MGMAVDMFHNAMEKISERKRKVFLHINPKNVDYVVDPLANVIEVVNANAIDIN